MEYFIKIRMAVFLDSHSNLFTNNKLYIIVCRFFAVIIRKTCIEIFPREWYNITYLYNGGIFLCSKKF